MTKIKIEWNRPRGYKNNEHICELVGYIRNIARLKAIWYYTDQTEDDLGYPICYIVGYFYGKEKEWTHIKGEPYIESNRYGMRRRLDCNTLNTSENNLRVILKKNNKLIISRNPHLYDMVK